MKKLKLKKINLKKKSTGKGNKKVFTKDNILSIILIAGIAIISIALVFALYIIISSPDFDKDTLYYETTVEEEKSILTKEEVTAVAEDKNASISKQDNIELSTTVDNIYKVTYSNWGDDNFVSSPQFHISLDLGYSLFVSGALIVIKDKGSVKSYAQISLQSKTERSQPAKEASSHATSKCFMSIYFLLPH